MDIKQSIVTASISAVIYGIYKGIKAYSIRSSCHDSKLEIVIVDNNEETKEQEEKEQKDDKEKEEK